jgi:hypothetical protein
VSQPSSSKPIPRKDPPKEGAEKPKETMKEPFVIVSQSPPAKENLTTVNETPPADEPMKSDEEHIPLDPKQVQTQMRGPRKPTVQLEPRRRPLEEGNQKGKKGRRNHTGT